MPTYDYQCTSCEYADEIFHKISQEPIKRCPKCGKDTLQRGIGGKNASFNFKGTGFYITDYSKAAKNDKKKD